MEAVIKIIEENVDLINYLAIELLEKEGVLAPSEKQIESMEVLLKREFALENK